MGQQKQSVSSDNCIRTLYTIGFILFVISLFIYFNPSPIDPQPYNIGPPPAVKISNGLDLAEVIFRQRRMLKGPESIAIDPSTNVLYTGTQDGKILKANLEKPYSSAPQMVGVIGDPSQALPLPCGTYTTEPICGRPLGMKFSNGSLYITDAYFGIFRYDTARHRLERYAYDFVNMYFKSGTGDSTGVFFNDVAVASSGVVYFTVSSTKFMLRDIMLDILEHRPNGLVAKYDPSTSKTTIITTDLYFPNGIILSPDEQHVYVAELAKARIIRILVAESAATSEGQQPFDVFVDNLPILPDNIAWVTDKELWIAGTNPRVDYANLPDQQSRDLASSFSFKLFDFLGNYPWLRKLITKIIPAKFAKIFLHHKIGGVVRVDAQTGQVIEMMVADPKGESGSIGGIAHSTASITAYDPGNLPDGQIHVYIGGFHPDVSSIGRLIWDTKTNQPVASNKQQNREKRREELRTLRHTEL